MVDNTITGHEFLLRTLGEDACPNRRCVRFVMCLPSFSLSLCFMLTLTEEAGTNIDLSAKGLDTR